MRKLGYIVLVLCFITVLHSPVNALEELGSVDPWTGGNGETWDNTNDGFLEAQGVGGSDNTDIRWYLDGTRPVLSSPTDTTIEIDDLLVIGNDKYIAFGTSSGQVEGNTANNALLLGVNSRKLILHDAAHGNKNFDHGTPAEITFFVHSRQNPDTDNTQWFSTSYSSSSVRAEMAVGGGYLYMNSMGLAPYSRTEAELKLISPIVAGLQYYDSTNKAVVISTGTSQGAFGQIINGSTACAGW